MTENQWKGQEELLLKGQEYGILYGHEFADRGFQPMTSDAGEDWSWQCERILGRARALLQGRNDAQVAFIAGFSNFVATTIVVKGKVHAIKEDGSREIIEPRTAWKIPTIEFVKMVCDVVQKEISEDEDGIFSIGEIDKEQRTCEVESLTISEVFATNAIVHCVRAFEHAHVDWLASCGFDFLLTAMECVVMAEQAARGSKRADARYEVNIRELTRNAAKERWARLEPVKQLAVKLFRQNDHLPSRAAAVREIETDIRREALKAGSPLSKENGRKTIDLWVRSFDPRPPKA